MSYDFKIQNNCDHLIQWALVYLDTDRKTIKLPHPISSSSSLTVRINNVVKAPTTYSTSMVRVPLTESLESYIYFKNKVKDYEPVIELRYVTISNYCPKCSGTGIIDDIIIEGHGDIRTISQESLLIQQLEKIIITKLSSNTFHSWYGSSLHSFIGKKITDKELLYSRVKEQVNVAIQNFKNIQKQLVSSGRKFDNGELFGRLLGITIEEADDPSLIEIIVRFTSKRETVLEYTQYLNSNNPTRQRVVLE